MARQLLDLTDVASAAHVGVAVDVADGDVITVHLTEIPSSGYQWCAAALPVGVDLLDTAVEARQLQSPGGEPLIGGAAVAALTFLVGDTPGGIINLRSVRRFDPERRPARTCDIRVIRAA